MKSGSYLVNWLQPLNDGNYRQSRFSSIQKKYYDTLDHGHEYRKSKTLWSKYSSEELTHSYESQINELLKNEHFLRCWYSSESLRSELGRPLWYADYMIPISDLRQAHAAIWFSLGALLSSLYVADKKAYEQDALSLDPRQFMLGPTASKERIKGALLAAEQLFSGPNSRNSPPELVVNMTANVIEGLARRLWPTEFTQKGRLGELRSILSFHSGSGTDHERRFSHLATTLYIHYRKPVTHNLGTFKCSWDEARFFYIGLRALIDIVEQIELQRNI